MKFIVRKKIITNIKSLRDYTKLFSPNDFNKNDNIILKYFGLYDVK